MRKIVPMVVLIIFAIFIGLLWFAHVQSISSSKPVLPAVPTDETEIFPTTDDKQTNQTNISQNQSLNTQVPPAPTRTELPLKDPQQDADERMLQQKLGLLTVKSVQANATLSGGSYIVNNYRIELISSSDVSNVDLARMQLETTNGYSKRVRVNYSELVNCSSPTSIIKYRTKYFGVASQSASQIVLCASAPFDVHKSSKLILSGFFDAENVFNQTFQAPAVISSEKVVLNNIS